MSFSLLFYARVGVKYQAAGDRFRTRTHGSCDFSISRDGQARGWAKRAATGWPVISSLFW